EFYDDFARGKSKKNSLFFTFFAKNGMYSVGTTHYSHSVNRNLFGHRQESTGPFTSFRVTRVKKRQFRHGGRGDKSKK
ncbi:hypothetical protein B7990_14245, partial [Fibrobacter sp. UWB4]